MVLEDGCRLIFHYVQQLHHHLSKGDRLKRVWDPTYTLVYRDSDSTSNEPGWSVPYVCRHIGKEQLPKSELIQYLQRKAQVRGGIGVDRTRVRVVLNNIGPIIGRVGTFFL